ncbi:MAG: hypothetical protein HY270_23280 [Deltaproteobacteria bacterium]|nr:hypothetical protein [Deltaproteobacteria bacterium]
MKHATDSALDRVETLLMQIRRVDELQEHKRGIFYWKSRAFLHFHEDPAGMFADVRVGDDFQRLPVNSSAERARLLAKVKESVAGK